MKTINEEELKTILENHKHWLKEDCEDWEFMKADLSNTDLRNVDLSHVDLSFADLNYAYLSESDLKYVDLSYANLSHTNFSSAFLSHVDLNHAYIRYADLSYTTFINVDLSYTTLSNANLSYAKFSHVDFRNTDISNTDFQNTDITTTDCQGSNLSYAKNVPYIPMICPEEGSFIGWKTAVIIHEKSIDKVLVKLRIPADAKRTSTTSRKCRCNKAKVLKIYNLDGTVSKEKICHSNFNRKFIYEVGKTVKVDDFDNNRWNQCTEGIHFFINRQEALNY